MDGGDDPPPRPLEWKFSRVFGERAAGEEVQGGRKIRFLINMDSGPVSTFQVHEHLRPKLCDIYENDSIFDKFECCMRGDGQRVATGSYSNLFRVFGGSSGSTEATTLEASKNPMRSQGQTPPRPSRSFSSITRAVKRGSESPVDANGNTIDFTTKLLHLAWHPSENSIACAAGNSLYTKTF